MRFFFSNVVVFFVLTSCSNINFLLDTNDQLNFLNNKTSVYINGWDNPILKDVFFLKFGEVNERRFLLTVHANEKQTKRHVNENQVALKIDYKITIDYSLSDTTKSCPEIKNRQVSRFSFTPKSSGYNFASDILLKNLYEEAILKNVSNFISLARKKIISFKCLNEN